jgi:membrane protease YdiL (CAAX protease family)
MTETLPDPLLPPAETSRIEDVPQLLAPWFHTLGIVALLAGLALFSHFGHREITTTDHPVRYCSQMFMIWMLLGCVVAGLYHRRLFFWNTLQHNRRPWFLEIRHGIAIYAAYMVTFALALGAFAFVMGLRHTDDIVSSHAHTATNVHNTDGIAVPSQDSAVHQQVTSHLHLKNKVVQSIAPTTAFELLLWAGVSFTAGFCEEHIFRGYLLRQSIAFLRGTGTSPRFAAILSVAITSILFGSLHLYEGIGGAVFIGLLGLVFATLALRFGNLRAVIVAHSVQDFLVGLFLFLRHLHQVR